MAGALRPGSREELEAWWEAASIEEQRAALRAALRRPWYGRRHRGGNRFQEDWVAVEWSWALYARIGKKGMAVSASWTEEQWAEAEEEHYRLAAEAERAGR